MSKSLQINCIHANNGPGIFSKRLARSLLDLGVKFEQGAKNQLSIISGPYKKGLFNILRLDGLYFNPEHPENLSIFECYKKADHIIFQGEFCKAQYEAFTGIKKENTIIRNGVTSDFFIEPFQDKDLKKKRIVASASWRRHKRLEEIIACFDDPRLKNFELHVLGGHDYWRGKYKPKNVNLYKFSDPSKLASMYSQYDAMIHLSWLDWCPNTVVEALACGLPVLCSHNGGTKELVRDNGIVIKLEEDYIPGTEVDLTNPPEVDRNIIVEGLLKLVEIPKDFTRDDLRIENVAKQYYNILK